MDFGAADDEGEAGHGHDALLGGGHAEVDVVLLHIDGNHGERRGGVEHRDGAILVGQGADFADGVEDARAGLVVGGVDEGDVGVLLEGLLHEGEVGALEDTTLEVDMRQVVVLAHLDGARGIGAVVDDEGLLTLGEEGVEADVDVDGAGAGEEDGGVVLGVGMDDLQQVGTEAVHEACELFLARADVGHHLGHLHGVGGGGGTGIEEDVTFDVHFFKKFMRASLFWMGVVVGRPRSARLPLWTFTSTNTGPS